MGQWPKTRGCSRFGNRRQTGRFWKRASFGSGGLCRLDLGGFFRPQLLVIFGPPLGIEKATPRRGDFIEQRLRLGGALADLHRTQELHLPVGRIGDHVRVVLELPQPDEPIVVRGLLLRSNPEPGVVGIKVVGHDRLHFRGSLYWN